ncbi:MAG: hypothetical protein AAFV93_14830 [Chloroflexota bacterium]
MSHSIYIDTLFRWCVDVVPMRHFYTEILQLEETFFRNDDEHGWLTYQVGDVQLVFIRATDSLPIESSWAISPAHDGDKELDSWVIRVTEPIFTAVKERATKNNVPIYEGEYDRDKHLIVRDPMGMTIAIWLNTA